MAAAVSATALAELGRLKEDYPYYARKVQRILTKRGEIQPFVLNRAQQFLHQQIEGQLASLGMVRIILLKMRQGGASTYLQGRMFHRISMEYGKRGFILTHRDDATLNLFEMGKRYLNLMPTELRPSVKSESAKTLWFDRLGSGYSVATAGGKGAGRSFTGQYFHGSEFAFWANAKLHMAGIAQAVPFEAGTEMYLETTANGIGNLAHEMWQDAIRGIGDYAPIFMPWYWMPEYARAVPEDFDPTQEEAQLQEVYGLTLEQIYWRRSKITNDFRGDSGLFAQEYPANPEEAFLGSSEMTLIAPLDVVRSRREVADAAGPLLMAIDPAELGDDATAFAFRQGRVAFPIERHYGKRTMEVVGLAVDRIMRLRAAGMEPEFIFVDVVGLGSGIADRMAELNYPVIRVNFGEKATRDDLYVNKRAECWGSMRDWIWDRPNELPDEDVLQSELTGPRYSYDSARRLKIERKEDMRKRGLKSPDGADALAMTFAIPTQEGSKKVTRGRRSNWRTT